MFASSVSIKSSSESEPEPLSDPESDPDSEDDDDEPDEEPDEDDEPDEERTDLAGLTGRPGAEELGADGGTATGWCLGG